MDRPTASQPDSLTQCCFQAEQTRMRAARDFEDREEKNRFLIPGCSVSMSAHRFEERGFFILNFCSSLGLLKGKTTTYRFTAVRNPELGG